MCNNWRLFFFTLAERGVSHTTETQRTQKERFSGMIEIYLFFSLTAINQGNLSQQL
ncbi:hypothetical protein NIES3585_06840 [Nodularia sp. NIES-3585]|nr:hypothetical protein NIES3585_06840 [Nodularia sp. NIES-3585]